MDSGAIAIRKPFIDHLHELRARLVWIALTVTVGAGAAFAIHQELLSIIQKPLDQTLYFTSPTGGLTFIFKLCLTVGFVVGFPVIVYHLYQFLSPLIVKQKRSTIFGYISASFVMALGGTAFAYFISLPAALHFLTQFGGENIESLIKADEYFSFALAYIGGFAILFQIPLVVMFINKITPLNPGGMMRAQRWIILGSFIGAAIITPTPDPINQALMAAPAIVLYQLSIMLIWAINRSKKSSRLRPAPIVTPKKNSWLAQVALSSLTSPSYSMRGKKISDFVVAPKVAARPIQKPTQRYPIDYRKRQQVSLIVARPARSIDGII